jgi:hypothetical protein
MAITYIDERQGSASRSDNILQAARVLLYRVTDGDDPAEILLQPEIPPHGEVHPRITGIFAGDVGAPAKVGGSEVDGAFTVQVQYTANTNDISSIEFDKDTVPWQQDPRDVSFDSREIVVPQTKAYQDGDRQFEPTKPLVHPATGESLLADTVERNGLISFSYSVRRFNYDWKLSLEGTANRDDVTILGYRFPAQTLLLRSLGVTRRLYTSSGDFTDYYWEITPVFEDFKKPIKKEIALQGFTHIIDSNTQPIQLSDGEFGYFNDPSKNVTTARFVDKSGTVLPAGTATIGDDFYEEYQDVYFASWDALDIPTQEV